MSDYECIRNVSEILKSFNAVVINYNRLKQSFHPSYERPAGQRLGWLMVESTTSSNGIVDKNLEKQDCIFTWTMTCQRDSDIEFSYCRIYPTSNRYFII